MRRLALAPCFLVLLLLGAAKPTPPPLPKVHKAHKAPKAVELPAQIVISGDVHIPRGASSASVVILHGKAVIDGTVRGDVVVFKGPIVVSGLVKGDVVALDGDVFLHSGGHVTGDVWRVHGVVHADVGSRIDGRIRQGGWIRLIAPTAIVARVAVWLAVTVSTLFLGLLLILFGPRGADAVFEAARTGLWPAIGWGFALFFGLPLAAVILLVTLVGIPFGLGLLLALGLLYSIGYAWSAWTLGRVMVRASRHGRGPRRYPAFLAGWAILRAVGFVPVLGLVTWLLAAVFGLGLMAVALWRARRGPATPASPPEPVAELVEGPPTASPT